MKRRYAPDLPDVKTDVLGRPIKMGGMDNIKGEGVILPLLKGHLEEIARCKNDIIYFAENYCRIVSLDKGEHYIELTDYQKELLLLYQRERFVCVLQSRQTYKSTTTAIFCVHSVCFNTDYSILMGSNSGVNAREIFVDRVMQMYLNIPVWLKPGVREFNKSRIVLETNSKILSGQVNDNFGRGSTFNCVYSDETAFVDPKTWDKWFMAIYPAITSGRNQQTKFIMTSTANGINHFYDIYNGALKKKNAFVPFEVHWTMVPRTDEEKKKFEEQTISNIGEEKWRQEFMNEFTSAENGLFSPTALKRFNVQPTVNTLYEGKFRIYKEPIKTHEYINFVDCAEGTGGDNSVINVIDVSTKPFEQVAVFQDNQTQLTIFPSIIQSVALMYNNALSVIENNSVGQYVVWTLWEDDTNKYENVYFNEDKQEPGIRMTTSTKKTGAVKLKEMVENGLIDIVDHGTIREMSNFVSVGSSFAGVGSTDDICMTLVMFGFFSTLEYFQESYNTGWVSKFYNKEIMEHQQEIEDEYDLPLIYHNNGNSDGYMGGQQGNTITINNGSIWN